MINKKHILVILLSLFIVCAVISVTDSVSAAKYKKIDSGNSTIYKSFILSKWNTKSNGKTVKVNWKLYAKDYETNKYFLYSKSILSFKKNGKTKIRGILINYKTRYVQYSKAPIKDSTKLSVNKYYFKKVKPLLKKPPIINQNLIIQQAKKSLNTSKKQCLS